MYDRFFLTTRRYNNEEVAPFKYNSKTEDRTPIRWSPIFSLTSNILDDVISLYLLLI